MTRLAFFVISSALVVAGCAPKKPDPLAESPGMKRALATIAKAPDTSSSYYMRGYLAALVHDEGAVRENFDHGIRLDPDNPGLRRGYGWSLFLIRDYAGALRQWQKRAELTNYQAYDVYYSLALGEWRTGRYADAIAHFQTATEKDPRFKTREGLLQRTSGWHPEEQQALLEIQSRWSYFY